jgi:hypothetical protein
MEDQYYNPKTGKVHIKQNRYRLLFPDDDEKKMLSVMGEKLLGSGRNLNKWLDTRRKRIFYCGTIPYKGDKFSYQESIKLL